jgi:hypothetical protein
MKLNRLTERVWVYPYEEKRDRPNLSYIRGDNWSLADKLAQTVREINSQICLPGHWTPLSPEIIIQDLLEGEG